MKNKHKELNLPGSTLIKSQKKIFSKVVYIDNKQHLIDVVVKYDDDCSNGHNTFSITGSVYSSLTSKADRYNVCCGCIHDAISEHFPELNHLIKWHLCSSNEPMYYIENTTYHAKNGNLNAARETAIWQDATIEQLSNKDLLLERLPTLMQEFKKDIEAIGFIY